eukprot:TRINITY_DN3843_c0_g2_i1.p1 TRINITY_DN3843_c0_g2~~TRINITY_DN3843_c0_g2_i1.p1  ORF type:complete len:295 (+),score=12.26 TRINITY_DN3843_c0_g2_i1:197-1081(+)
MAALTASASAVISSTALVARRAAATSLSASSQSLVAAPVPLRAAVRSSSRTHIQRCRAAADAKAASKDEEAEEDEDEDEEDGEVVPIGNGAHVAAPEVAEIHSLLTDLCDETLIAELKVKVGKFSLRVLREVPGVAAAAGAPAAAPVIYAPPVPAFPMADSLPAAAPAPPAEASEKPEDKGLQFIVSPRVGIVRRGKLYKGKHGRPIVLEGAIVKKGQALCFLEQLGTNLSVEAEIAGEVVEFLVDDGAPVGYGEPLVAIRPSFPGIMISRRAAARIEVRCCVDTSMCGCIEKA